MLKVNKYVTGTLQTNCYLVTDEETNRGLIIDPGETSPELEKDLQNLNSVDYILLTHGHFDHILKTAKYKKLTSAKIVMCIDEQEFAYDSNLNLSFKYYKEGIENFTPDILVQDGASLEFGSTQIKIISTPGHTKGGVCYIINNNIFSGDTLFKRSIGRTKFPTGDPASMKASLEKLYGLEKDYNVYPGHSDSTTLFSERNNNTGL